MHVQLVNLGPAEAVVAVDIAGWMPAEGERLDEIALPAGQWIARPADLMPDCAEDAAARVEIEVTASDGSATPLQTPDELRWLRENACSPLDLMARMDVQVSSFERADGVLRVNLDVARAHDGGDVVELVATPPSLGVTLGGSSEMSAEIAAGEESTIEAQWFVTSCAASPETSFNGPYIHVETTARTGFTAVVELPPDLAVELGRFIAAECDAGNS